MHTTELLASALREANLPEMADMAETGYYHDFLMREAEAAPARRYLQGRGLAAETVKAFRLGYAPRGAEAFLNAARRKGLDPAVLVKAGLAARRENGTHRDYFWGRIMYPIQNARGETVGFGARVMGDGEPKYLNSPETPLFSKGRILYGFFEGLARIRKERRVALMEGYMDVIAAHQAGFTYACAPLGTALTDDHLILIKRYAEESILLFDPDAAGSAAALRGAEMLLERGAKVNVATVPGGLDPDELLMKGGPKALEKCLAEAADLAEFRTVLSLKGRSGAFLEPEEKSRVAAEVLQVIRLCPDEVLKREWIRRLAQKLDTGEEPILLELRRSSERPRSRTAVRKEPVLGFRPLPVEESDMLAYLFRKPSLALSDEFVAGGDFADERARRIFEALRAFFAAQGAAAAPAGALEGLGPQEKSFATALLCSTLAVDDPAAALAALVSRRRKERRFREIEPLVVKTVGEAGSSELHQEYQRLLSDLKGTRKGEQG